MKRLTYLATPYSHPDPAVRAARFDAVNLVAARLMLRGEIIFSPISHTHPIALAADLPKSWDFWEHFDRAYLEASQKLIVLQLDGWEQSTGVQAEIAIAESLGIPIEYLELSGGLDECIARE